jgi:hypothetical protein
MRVCHLPTAEARRVENAEDVLGLTVAARRDGRARPNPTKIVLSIAINVWCAVNRGLTYRKKVQGLRFGF